MLVAGVSAYGSAFAAPAESTINIQGHVFSYLENHPLAVANPDIEQAIIIIHGSDRNADVYYRTGEIVAEQLKQAKSTMVIAPHFKEKGDPIVPNELVFTSEGWLRGDLSKDRAMSSFSVIDEFINRLSDASLFPKLKTIIITGHSAGGQLTQRYALGSPLQPQNIAIRYVVTNPGSYAYLTSERPVKGSPGVFTIPHTSCSNYDDYKYGLQHLNEYLSQTSTTAEIVNRYLNRDVTYLIGEADVITDELDNDCPAQLQGVTRFERGKNFKAELDHAFPSNQHKIATVPGVGHSERLMYTSPVGLKVLFPTAVIPVAHLNVLRADATKLSPAPESTNRKLPNLDRPSVAKTHRSFLSPFFHPLFQP